MTTTPAPSSAARGLASASAPAIISGTNSEATSGAIPYIDLAAQHRPLKTQLLAAVARVIDHGQFILGPEVTQFEQRFAQLTGVKHAIGVNSGTDALILALRALHIGPGDEVITAPNSFVATASAIALVGATPVFADVDDSYNLDPTKIPAVITPRTKAILPVHLTGRAADMTALTALAKQHNLALIEDAAQAVLAEHRHQKVGSFGAAGCFSLHPLKTLNACGDAGVITTNDAALASQLRILRNLGLRTREQCETFSGNSRLDTIQAAMLLVKLDYLEEWTDRRRANAALYRQLLTGIDAIQLPAEHTYERAVYHTFVIQADRRDQLKTYLAGQGIATNIHYPIPIHQQIAAQSLSSAARGLASAPKSFPRAEHQATRILSLPIYPELTHAQIVHITTQIRRFYHG